MKFIRIVSVSFVVCIAISAKANAQAENVPVSHPIYVFLKRMEVRGIIERYFDAILPLSRNQIAEFLSDVRDKSDQLSKAERGYLHDFLSEFQYDVSGSIAGFHSLVNSSEPTFGAALGEIFSNREKYLYAYTDTNLTFFVNGLLTFDGRSISGDALGNEHAEFVQFGGRIRGTIFGKLGFYLQGTNAQFRGSRALLRRDRTISQSFALRTTNATNFDFVEGYARYDADIVSVQIGRERALWGNGYSEKMILSDNVRVFDFIRADAQYKSLKYTFFHAWLLGKRSNLSFTLPFDTSSTFNEPIVADKYFAAHRIEFSFPGLFDIGAQEMVIYSNRAPDLAYLNPFTVIESAQRSREERDNVFWSFDVQTHFLPNLEMIGTFLFDDINFPDLFTDVWTNRYAFQAGAFYADPFTLPNTSVMVEYTRIEPYVFAHNRSRENDYGSLGAPLSSRIGPNADAWFIRTDYLPARNFYVSASVMFVRKGENFVDEAGRLINVGGDILQPHRAIDPPTKKFLDGILVKTRIIKALASYELVNQLWLEASYAFESIDNSSPPSKEENHTFVARVRMEL